MLDAHLRCVSTSSVLNLEHDCGRLSCTKNLKKKVSSRSVFRGRSTHKSYCNEKVINSKFSDYPSSGVEPAHCQYDTMSPGIHQTHRSATTATATIYTAVLTRFSIGPRSSPVGGVGTWWYWGAISRIATRSPRTWAGNKRASDT